MRYYWVALLFLFSCASKPAQNIDGVAELLVKSIEEGNIASIRNYMPEELLKRSTPAMDSLVQRFVKDHRQIAAVAKRYTDLEFEDGNLYRYRYITDIGTELQVEFILEQKTTGVELKKMTLIPIDSFRMERDQQRVPYKISIQ